MLSILYAVIVKVRAVALWPNFVNSLAPKPMSILLNALNRLGRPKSAIDGPPAQTVFLLGPPCSQSTQLHRLMALHPQLVAPSLKELMFPGKGNTVMRGLVGILPPRILDRVSPSALHRTGAHEAEADDMALWAAFSEGLFAWAYEGGLRSESGPIIEPLRHVSYLKTVHTYLAQKNSGKVVWAKYVAGIQHFSVLKALNPQARFVLLVPDPEEVCDFLSTLIESVLQARRIRLSDPQAFWGNLYRFIVETYRQIRQLEGKEDERVLLLSDEQVKRALPESIDQICVHAGLSTEGNDRLDEQTAQALSAGPYEKCPPYSEVMKPFFSRGDFRAYYAAKLIASL